MAPRKTQKKAAPKRAVKKSPKKAVRKSAKKAPAKKASPRRRTPLESARRRYVKAHRAELVKAAALKGKILKGASLNKQLNRDWMRSPERKAVMDKRAAKPLRAPRGAKLSRARTAFIRQKKAELAAAKPGRQAKTLQRMAAKEWMRSPERKAVMDKRAAVVKAKQAKKQQKQKQAKAPRVSRPSLSGAKKASPAVKRAVAQMKQRQEREEQEHRAVQAAAAAAEAAAKRAHDEHNKQLARDIQNANKKLLRDQRKYEGLSKRLRELVDEFNRADIHKRYEMEPVMNRLVEEKRVLSSIIEEDQQRLNALEDQLAGDSRLVARSYRPKMD